MAKKTGNIPEKHTKKTVIIAEVDFLIIGIVLIALGTFYTVTHGPYKEAMPKVYVCLPSWAIILGVFMLIPILLAFFNLKDWMLFLLSGTLFFLFFAQLTLGIFAVTSVANYDGLKDEVEVSLITSFDDSEKSDKIQENAKCCGVTGPDWWKDFQKVDAPSSCTSDDSESEDGCNTVVADKIHSMGIVIGIFSLVSGLVEAVAASLPFWIAISRY